MAPIFHLGWAASILAQAVAGAEPHGWWDVLRHDVIPVAAAYLVFLGLLITYHRATRMDAGPGRRADEQRGVVPTDLAAGWGHLVRYVVGTVVGGYVFFLSIVVVFYFILGGEDREFIRQGLEEGALLAFALVVPAFLVFSAIADLRSHRGGKKH